MLLEVLWLALKVLAVLVAGFFLIFAGLHVRALLRIRFYEKQGAVTYPGAKTFVVGNLLDFAAYGKAAAEETEDPLPNPS